MRDTCLSNCEKNFIQKIVSQGHRLDGRNFNETRKLDISFGSEYGCCIVSLGETKCRNLSEYMKIAEKVKEFFHNEGIHSTTIQPEFVEGPQDENENQSGAIEAPCALHCPPNDLCHNATCCGPNQQETLTPPAAVTPYMCRQRNMASRSESVSSNIAGNAPKPGWNLEALECGSLLPSPLDGRLTV